MPVLMMKNPDLSSLFHQMNRNPCVHFNSNSGLEIVLDFINFSIFKGFSLLQSQVYFKVLIGVSISPKHLRGAQPISGMGKTVLCQDL